MDHFKVLLPEYQWVGVGRNDGVRDGEFALIGFRRSSFVLMESGNFWLSETPDTPSKGWDAVNFRIATFVVLRPKSLVPQPLFILINTHLDAYGAMARIRGAQLVIERARALFAKYSKSQSPAGPPLVFLTCDLNCEPDSEPYSYVTGADIFVPGKAAVQVPHRPLFYAIFTHAPPPLPRPCRYHGIEKGFGLSFLF